MLHGLLVCPIHRLCPRQMPRSRRRPYMYATRCSPAAMTSRPWPQTTTSPLTSDRPPFIHTLSARLVPDIAHLALVSRYTHDLSTRCCAQPHFMIDLLRDYVASPTVARGHGKPRSASRIAVRTVAFQFDCMENLIPQWRLNELMLGLGSCARHYCHLQASPVQTTSTSAGQISQWRGLRSPSTASRGCYSVDQMGQPLCARPRCPPPARNRAPRGPAGECKR